MNAERTQRTEDPSDYTCRECGETDNPKRWIGGEKIAAKRLCFACNHWDGLLARKDDLDVVRVKGVHYVIGQKGERWPGFGGHRFKIRFHDGREEETTNLWCQGHIAEHFKARMPDNAEFLEGMGS